MFDLDLNWADVAIVSIVAISCVVSVIRGFVSEALSLFVWAGAIWIALMFSSDVADAFKGQINSPMVRSAVGFVLLFFGSLVLGAILSAVVTMLVNRTGLTGTDRVLGVVFGAARGILVVSVILLLAKFSTMPHDSWWQQSKLIGKFDPMEVWLQNVMQDQVKTLIPSKAKLAEDAQKMRGAEIKIPPLPKKDFDSFFNSSPHDDH